MGHSLLLASASDSISFKIFPPQRRKQQNNKMKKYIVSTIATIVLASAAYAGAKCIVCKGSGWQGNYRCASCGGDGEIGN